MELIIKHGSDNLMGLTLRATCVPIAFATIALGNVVFAQSLQESVQIALSQYPTILAAQSRTQAADYDIMRAQGAHYPQIAWSGTQSTYNTGNIPNNWIQSPTLTMNVWSGWAIESDVERSKALADAGRQQQRITRDDVALLAIEAYLNWARALQLVDLAQTNLKEHERIRRDIATITEIDIGRRVDLDQAQVRFENASLSLQQRQAELAVASQRLSRMLLGRIPAKPDGVESIVGRLPSSPDEALGHLIDSHPVIALKLAQVQAAKASVGTARAQHSPTINVSYGKQVNQGSGQGDYVAQLNVSIPLFTGGTATGATGTALANLQAAEFDLRDTRLVLREKLLSAWSEYFASKSRAALGAKQARTAQSLVSGYESQFRIGRRSLLDLLNVQNDLYTYQSNALGARFDERISYARIMATIGKLAMSYTSAQDMTNESTALPGMNPQTTWLLMTGSH
jgi:adhesin transport system outer membrane protein